MEKAPSEMTTLEAEMTEESFNLKDIKPGLPHR